MSLRAPFPWFGGKSRVAHLVWDRFGDVPNYVEPFAGSLAVLLARPTEPGTETVNDKDAFLANFWRAVQADPEAVAQWADWPVNEADLHARHRWLVGRGEFRELMAAHPDHYDVRIAGWWVWGVCSTIGEAWLRSNPQAPAGNLSRRGIRSWASAKDGLAHLSRRLSSVNVLCGDWQRAVSESRTVNVGVTGVFLDPPYESDCDGIAYADTGAAVSARQWAIENGENPRLRIALCGYEGEHEMPDSWAAVAWKATGGYGSLSDGQGRENAKRERIWFSTHCLKATQPSLFTHSEEQESCTDLRSSSATS